MLLESFKDAERIWISQGNEKDEITKLISIFKELKTKNQISGDEKDIGYWMNHSFDEFKDFIASVDQEYKENRKNKAIEKDIIRFFENEFALVVVPKTHEACQKYGSHTKWCITGYNDTYWKDYMFGQGLTPYIVIFKYKANIDRFDTALEKIAFMVNYESTGEFYDIYDTQDNEIFLKTTRYNERGEDYKQIENSRMSLEEILDMYKIPYDDFTSRMEEDYDSDSRFYYDTEMMKKFFNESEAVSDLKEFYEETNVPEDERIDDFTFEEYFSQEEFVDHMEQSDFTNFTHSDELRKFQDFINRSIKYPETKYVQAVIDDFEKDIEKQYSNYDEPETHFRFK
jgi:hypothetical protein